MDVISLSLDQTLEEAKAHFILAVLDKYDDNRTHAAKALGISTRGLQRNIPVCRRVLENQRRKDWQRERDGIH